MFDQSFSAKNFYKILIRENRKGLNLEKLFFEKDIYIEYTLKIKELNKKLRTGHKTFKSQDHKSRKPSKELYARYKKIIRFYKQKLKQEKEERLLLLLEKISINVQKPYFKFKLITNTHKNKTIYSIDNSPESFFVMKQLQYNFQKLYGIKQANRFEIVNQVKCILNDKFPKYIVRTDIREFYESIPTFKIIGHLNSDNLLSPKSKKIIKQILKEYETISGLAKGIGIPRGIGISAYLAEYYMRRIDSKLSRLIDTTYYARYVDDIIIIFTPKNSYQIHNYKDNIKGIIEKEHFLKLHPRKTEEINLIYQEDEIMINGTKQSTPHYLNYLGYSYKLINKKKKQNIPNIEIFLTPNKILRYKDKIKESFIDYEKYKDKNKGYRHLKNRIKFLTGNMRLLNNKNNVLVGIYYSNMLLTNSNSLVVLDKYLHWYIRRKVKTNSHKSKLLNYSFKTGFDEKIFYHFNNNQFKQITRVW